MDICKSDVVCSLAGRDRGQLFYVIKREKDYVLIADGRGRKIDKLKRKNPKHLRLITASDCRLKTKILNGEKFTDSEIRRSLQQIAVRENGESENGEKGGMYFG